MRNPGNQPPDCSHLLEMYHLPAEMGFVRDLRSVNDLHLLVQRNSFEFICSMTGQLELMMRKGFDVGNTVEKIRKGRVGQENTAIVGDNRDRNGYKSK